MAAALGTCGRVDVLLHSPLPSLVWIKPVVDTTSEDPRPSLELSVLGAVDAVGAVLPGMLDRGAGTLLFTTGGAAVAPSERRAGSAGSGTTPPTSPRCSGGSTPTAGRSRPCAAPDRPRRTVVPRRSRIRAETV